jgi:hypothetical protein
MLCSVSLLAGSRQHLRHRCASKASTLGAKAKPFNGNGWTGNG